MAVRVIHFGLDGCYRVRVLQAAGYEVKESRSLIELRNDLQESQDSIAAVFVSDDDQGAAEEAASIAQNTAPVIMFRRGTWTMHHSKFVRIIDSTVSPSIWLRESAEFITKSRALREDAQYLPAKSVA